MNLSAIEKRIRTLETITTQPKSRQRPTSPSDQQIDPGMTPWSGQLEELTEQARLIMEQAKVAGDRRTALAAIRLRCYIVELADKLSGNLDERSLTNVVVNLDPEIARRMAQTYLDRHKPLELESK